MRPSRSPPPLIVLLHTLSFLLLLVLSLRHLRLGLFVPNFLQPAALVAAGFPNLELLDFCRTGLADKSAHWVKLREQKEIGDGFMLALVAIVGVKVVASASRL